MSRLAAPVGDAAARTVHGYSDGAQVVLAGTGPGAAVTQSLADLGLVVSARVTGTTGAGTALAELADLLEGGTEPMVLAAADLELAMPGLLDLLDRPGVRTAVLVADPAAVTDGADRMTLARVGGDGRLVESVGSPAHTVTRPGRALPGILRVQPGDRPQAAHLLREAARVVTADWGCDLVGLATLVLVRGGVAVQAVALGPFDWAREGVRAEGAPGDAWRQRLRGASRGGDGFFSTFAVRPLSRRVTAMGLARGWTPNVVTVTSLVLGVLAAVLVATGSWWAWVAGAVLLLASLVVDCVDGEIARFTRRFSPFGAFLDAVGDRVKEYAVLAAVAAVAVRAGQPGWPVALAAMAAVTLRHLEDYGYGGRLAPSLLSRPDLLPVSEPWDRGPATGRTTLLPAPSARARAVDWAKRVVHMPIGERYLLLAVTLLTHRPMLVLWTLLVAVLVAVAWTQGGRVVAVLVGRDRSWAAVRPAVGRAQLDDQLDLGPVAQLIARAGRLPWAAGATGAAVLVVAVPLLVWQGRPLAAAVIALAGTALLGLGWQPPLHHRLGWQAPAALWVAEAVTVGIVVHHSLEAMSAAGFAYLCAVAYHRYDTVYRLRDTGVPPARWLATAGLGCDGRLVALLLLTAPAPNAVVPTLWVLAAALAVLYTGESAAGWRRWISAQRVVTPQEPRR